MKILRNILNGLSKKRQHAIAWLTLEGWEPKVDYRSQTGYYNKAILVRDKLFLEGDDTSAKDIRFVMGIVIAGSWDIFTTRQLLHFVVVANWMRENK